MGVIGFALVMLLGQAPSPQVVTGVELRLPPGTDPALVEQAPRFVAVRKGQELSMRAVQRTIQLLMGTGHFADVVVYGEVHEGGVEVVIEASVKRRVGEVFVEKRTGALSSDAVIAASKLEAGAEYSPEAMAEAIEGVRQAYRRKGYLNAQVEPQAAPGARGVDVVLAVTEGDPTRLSGVTFAGETGLPLRRMLATLALEIGEVVDQDLVEKGAERLRALLRAERYYRARVEAPVLDETGHLSIPLRSGPRYTVQLKGNRRFPDSLLEAVNAYDGAETLDRAVIDRMAQKLTAFYRYRGFFDARVLGYEAVARGGREARLVFEIDEGEVLVVRELEFEGNQAVTDRELLELLVEVMKTTAPQPSRVASSFVDGLQAQGRVAEPMLFDMPSPPLETVLVEPAFREAAQAMRAVYRDRGYIGATVELEPVVVEGRRARVRYVVSEGPRVLVEEVRYEGGPAGFPPAGGSRSRVGEPFSPRAVERAAQGLATDLARRGYLYAKVDGEWAIEVDQAKLTFRISLGPQVTVGKVLVRGLKRTDEAVARRALQIEEGKLLNPDDLLDSQRNLVGLGIFRTAEVRLLAPETAEPVKDVLVELVEAPRLQFEGSFGYYLAEGVRVGGDVQVPNLGGQALSLVANVQGYYFGASAPAATGRVDVSNIPQYLQFGGRANVSLQNRGLLARGLAVLTGSDTRVAKALRGADIGTRLDVVGERVFRQSYQFNRVAVVPGLDWSGRFDVGVKWARLKLTLLWQYEFDVSDVRPVRSFTGAQLPLLRTDTERLRFLFGTFALSTLRFAPTLDLRDDPVLPHKGFVLSTPIETTGAQFAQDNLGNPVKVQFVKLSGQLTAYFPLGPVVVLAVSGRVGNIFPLRDSITPPVKRFFLGGAANLRGFPEDSMLPEDVRSDYRGDVRSCQALANPFACSEVAQNIRDGRYQPSPGGEFFVLGKTELRFPFVGDLNLGFFFETGNLWLDPRRIGSTLRYVAGGGLRYLSPIGPLALDVGFNLQPDLVVNEALFNVHFNVGVF